MSKVIGIYALEPTFSNPDKYSPTGLYHFLNHLVMLYHNEGHSVVWLLGTGPAGTHKLGEQISDLDVAIVMWRWRMPKYPERDTLYFQMWQLLLDLEKANVPTIIHDQDYKMVAHDYLRLRNMNNAFVASSVFSTANNKLIYPYPYLSYNANDLSLKINNWNDKLGVAYIGNNYERYESAQAYFNAAASSTAVRVWGNWISEGRDERQEADQVQIDMPHVIFEGKIPQQQAVQALSNGIATIHLGKDKFYDTNFIAMRWAEAVEANTLGFIPIEFSMKAAYAHYQQWFGSPKIAKSYLDFCSVSPIDFAVLLNEISANYGLLQYLLEAQREFVLSIMTDTPWLDILEC